MNVSEADPNRWPVKITFHHADGRTYNVVPPEHTVLDVVWDRQMVERETVDYYQRNEPGPKVTLTVTFRRVD